MNEELEPLGMPESAQGEGPHTLSELISQHPLAAVVASAAVGAGVVALIAAASQRRQGPALVSQVQDQAADTYAELRGQLARLVERFAAAMPTTAEAERQADKAAADLGAQAAGTWDTALDTARRALQGTMATGAQATQAATQTAMAHPVLTSIVVGAIGTAVASLAAQRRHANDGDDAMRPAPNGHDSSPSATAGTSPSL